MNKIFGSFILFCIFSIVPSAMGSITISAAYFVADAQVESSLGNDSENHAEYNIPVSAFAEIGETGNSVSSGAIAYGLTVSCWSVIDFQPETVGYASSSAGSIIFGLSSTTPWQIELESLYSIVPSDNGSVALSSQAFVFDGTGTTELYSYNLSVDGLTGQNIFGVGDYELRFFVTSYAGVLESSQVAESVSSWVELNATVTPIPVPSSALLAFFGVGLISRLRRGRIF